MENRSEKLVGALMSDVISYLIHFHCSCVWSPLSQRVNSTIVFLRLRFVASHCCAVGKIRSCPQHCSATEPLGELQATVM